MCGEDGRVWSGFSTQMGMYKYGRTWKEVDVGTHTHTHTLSCVSVCVLTPGKVSQTKNVGNSFSTGNPRRVCPGMRTVLEAGRNRENEREEKREPKNQEPRQPDRQTGARHEN